MKTFPLILSQLKIEWMQRYTAAKGPESLPWGLLSSSPTWEKVLNFHGQTLEKLAARGGLSPAEAVAHLKGMPTAETLGLSPEQISALLRAEVRAWEMLQTPDAIEGQRIRIRESLNRLEQHVSSLRIVLAESERGVEPTTEPGASLVQASTSIAMDLARLDAYMRAATAKG